MYSGLAVDVGRMTLFLVMFLAGWNDASQGPLLPSLQTYYNVSSSRYNSRDFKLTCRQAMLLVSSPDSMPSHHKLTPVSLIWIVSFVGFITSGIANVFMTDRLGFGIVR
jgi:hypothetical protein